MAFETGNPLGSSDFRDLSDNAVAFDKFANGPDPAYANRLGQLKLSVTGMNEEFDNAQEGRDAQFQAALLATGFIDIGNYAAGLTITLRNQVFARNGVYYSANAALVLPYTLTGNWAAEGSNFILRADAPLRSDLASANGATIVGDGTGTVATSLRAVEGRAAALESDVSALQALSGKTLGFAANPTEEAAQFAAGFTFVLRTDLLNPIVPPAPVYTLDQSFIPSTTPGLAKAIVGTGSAGGYAEGALSFTAGVSGDLGRVNVFTYRESGTGDMILEIRNDASGVPGSTVLGSATIPSFTSPSSLAGVLAAPQVVDLNGVTQVAGTKYWICLRPASSSSTAYYGLSASAEGTANVATRSAVGGSWAAVAGHHSPFRTYVRTPGV